MGYKVPIKGGYFPVSPADKYADVRDEMSRLLEEVGLIIERAHHEVGSGRPAGDQLPLRDAADRGRRHDEVQVHHQE